MTPPPPRDEKPLLRSMEEQEQQQQEEDGQLEALILVESDLKTVEATLLRVTVGNLNSESHEGHLATILGELSAKLDVCFSYLDSIPRIDDNLKSKRRHLVEYALAINNRLDDTIALYKC
eukprot:251326_1